MYKNLFRHTGKEESGANQAAKIVAAPGSHFETPRWIDFLYLRTVAGYQLSGNNRILCYHSFLRSEDWRQRVDRVEVPADLLRPWHFRENIIFLPADSP